MNRSVTVDLSDIAHHMIGGALGGLLVCAVVWGVRRAVRGSRRSPGAAETPTLLPPRLPTAGGVAAWFALAAVLLGCAVCALYMGYTRTRPLPPYQPGEFQIRVYDEERAAARPVEAAVWFGVGAGCLGLAVVAVEYGRFRAEVYCKAHKSS